MDNSGAMSKIEAILNVTEQSPGHFVGPVVSSTFERTFGGQVAAQTLVAALRTVPPEYVLHSLHGYFVGPGNPAVPTHFESAPIRDGRSFVSRHVTATQGGQALFHMQCSFHRLGDTGIEHSDDMRVVPAPEDIDDDYSDLPPSSRALLEEWTEWDLRRVPPGTYKPNEYTHGQQLVWFKTKHRLPDDEAVHLCTLAYMSDMTLLHTSLVPHPGHPVQMASLDHAMWFLRPFRADEWLLYDQMSPSAHQGRALTHGRIFNRHGDLVAMVTQEGLTRNLKPGAKSVPVTNLEQGVQ